MSSSLHIDITFLLIFETSKLDDEDIVVLKVDLRFCSLHSSLLSDKCCSSSDGTYSLSLSSLSLFSLSSSISIQMNYRCGLGLNKYLFYLLNFLVMVISIDAIKSEKMLLFQILKKICLNS